MTKALNKAIEAAQEYRECPEDSSIAIATVAAQVRNELQTVLLYLDPMGDVSARDSIANILRLMDALDGRAP
jgi:hypothetical protein